MPWGDPDSTDPMAIVGVEIPADEEGVREMAATFAGELALDGRGEEEIVAIFRDPFYAGPHLAWRVLGEAEIRRLCGRR